MACAITDIGPLPIDHVRHVAALRPRCSRSSARATFATSSRKSTFGMGADFAGTIAQLSVRSWDNGWDNRRGSTRDRIALKRRQRNDLVEFELFFRSQTLYPTELRARSKTLHCQQFTASSSSISTASFGSFEPLVRNPWMRYLSHAKQF